MTHFLDDLPLKWGDPGLQVLRGFLAHNYYKEREIEQWVLAATVPPEAINWASPARLTWTSVLEVARDNNRQWDLVNEIIAGAEPAIADRLKELVQAEPVVATPAPPAPGWTGDPLPERQVAAEPTLLDITFLQRGLELAPSVARLLVTLPTGQYYGTGFLIAPDLLLTNHHVLYDDEHGGEQAAAVEAWFRYERDFGGQERAHTIVAGDPVAIAGLKEEDWAVVRLDGTKIPAGVGPISLTDLGTPKVDDRVYIIQHPRGGPKQIGMIHNTVRAADNRVVQYLTDTEPGSSGSPVFDEHWRLVALHHQSLEVRVNGGTEIRNQGRTIQKVIAGLESANLL